MPSFRFNGSSQLLSAAAQAVREYPFTLFGWAKLDAATANQTIVSQGDTTSLDNYMRILGAGAAGGDPTRNQVDSDVSAFTQDEGAGFSSGVWQFYCGVTTASSIEMYLDGVSAGGTAHSTSYPTSQDNTTVGALRRSSTIHYLDGLLGPTGIYADALTPAQILALARGRNPLEIAEDRLALLLLPGSSRPFVDVVGGLDMTSDNGGNSPDLDAESAPVQERPSRVIFGWFPTATARRWSGMYSINRMGA